MSSNYNEKGELIPDQTPVEIPVGFGRPESLQSMIARLVQAESARAAETGEAETFEESDDFETDEETDLTTSFQMTDMHEEAPHLAKTLDPKEKSVPAEDKEYQAFLAWKEAQKKSEEGSSSPPTQ